ncbi:GntR family transcriptional regulator [Intrasporangium chromatireducens]|uniref:GntR family transcriptional regulator n=1 Tax=Intrasporangium chromatireducens TaxID=1386088 RepID=UPI0012DF31A0|nr:GntR family transcriptional regulator [Intrasporangium chromatireducens]
MARPMAKGPPGDPICSLDIEAVDPIANLRDQVANLIRAAILSGQMEPNIVYSAPVLAARLRVSPTPVREAMHELALERLVEVIPRKGFKVIELSSEEFDEIVDLRILIEVPIVGHIAQFWDEQRRGAFEHLRKHAFDLQRLAGEGDLIAYVQVDRTFHLQLLAISGNQHAVAAVGALHTRGRLHGLQKLAERGELMAHARDHEHLLSLLLRRDGEGASLVMRRHIACMGSDRPSSLLLPGEMARDCCGFR